MTTIFTSLPEYTLKENNHSRGPINAYMNSQISSTANQFAKAVSFRTKGGSEYVKCCVYLEKKKKKKKKKNSRISKQISSVHFLFLLHFIYSLISNNKFNQYQRKKQNLPGNQNNKLHFEIQ